MSHWCRCRQARLASAAPTGRGDILTDPGDVQAIFDNIPVAERKLQWIEHTTARWDGYLEFQRRPQLMLDWFAQYLATPRQRRRHQALRARDRRYQAGRGSRPRGE